MNYLVQATLDRVKNNKHYTKMLENRGFHELAQAQDHFATIAGIYDSIECSKRIITDKDIYFDITKGIGNYDKYTIHLTMSEI